MPTRQEMTDTFWSNLKNLIKQSDHTQRSLSVMMGHNEQYIESWIRRNALPDVYDAYQLASIFGTTVDSLLGIEKDENKSKALDLLRQAEALLEK